MKKIQIDTQLLLPHPVFRHNLNISHLSQLPQKNVKGLPQYLHMLHKNGSYLIQNSPWESAHIFIHISNLFFH